MSRRLALALIAVAFLAMLTLAAATDAAAAFDRAVLEIVRTPALREPLAALTAVTALGSTEVVGVAAGMMLLVGLLTRRIRLGLLGAAAMFAAMLVNAGLKQVVARVRPELLDAGIAASGFSFPSGHAMLSAVAYGILAVVLWRSRLARGYRGTAVAVLMALILLIGLSRVYLGAHYPTDVLAGWAAGSLVVLVFVIGSSPARRVPKTQPPQPANPAD